MSFGPVSSFVNSRHEREVEVKEEASRGRESPCPALEVGGGQMLPVSHVLRMARTQEALLSYVRTSVYV